MTSASAPSPPAPSPPWYREVSRDQLTAFSAAFIGWVLDGFDFMILSFIVLDIKQAFSVSDAAAGALATVTMLMRLVGGMAGGTAADRWGRKLPLILSILWFSLFSFLCGTSTSYAMLFALRAVFGIGMGGVYAAAMPLALEHWPAKYRGTASGVLQSGFSWGYMVAAVVFQFVFPLFDSVPGRGWRGMFWIGALPALLVPWIWLRVKESPVWLERQRHLATVKKSDGVSLLRIFRRDLIGTTLQTSLVIAAFIFSYHSTSFWYPTYLREAGLKPFYYVVCLNGGAIVGAIVWGRVSESRYGRRGAGTLGALKAIVMIPSFLMTSDPTFHAWPARVRDRAWRARACVGIIPGYLTERFPTAVRGVGPGFAYHAGAAIGAITPAYWDRRPPRSRHGARHRDGHFHRRVQPRGDRHAVAWTGDTREDVRRGGCVTGQLPHLDDRRHGGLRPFVGIRLIPPPLAPRSWQSYIETAMHQTRE